MHTTKGAEGISDATFSSHTHTVAFKKESIAVGHKPEALGSDRECCVWEFGSKGMRRE